MKLTKTDHAESMFKTQQNQNVDEENEKNISMKFPQIYKLHNIFLNRTGVEE